MEKKMFLSFVFDFIKGRFPFVDSEVAQFIACLAALESDFGFSFLAKENHNIIGMKMPKMRLSTALYEKHGHACYQSFETCLCDFMYWCQYYGMCQRHFKNLESFLRKFEKLNYNPSGLYVDRIINLKNQYYYE